MKFNIRLLYLYLFSAVGLIVTIIGTTRLVDLGLKVFVFKNADSYYTYPYQTAPDPEGKVSSDEAKKIEAQNAKFNEEETKRQRQRETSGAVAMIVVGLPLYLYHWKTIQKDNKAN
jgi:hypothetical protein